MSPHNAHLAYSSSSLWMEAILYIVSLLNSVLESTSAESLCHSGVGDADGIQTNIKHKIVTIVYRPHHLY